VNSQADMLVPGWKESMFAIARNNVSCTRDLSRRMFAFAKDPTGEKASLIPVRVESVKLEGLLSQFVYIDLVGKDEKTAINALLNGIRRERAKPSKLPGFPGDRSRTTTNKPLTFPGAALPPPLELVPFVKRFENDYPEPSVGFVQSEGKSFIRIQFCRAG